MIRRTLLIPAIALLCAFGVTATSRPTRVLILGDSVMAGAASRYAVHLPGREVTVDALENRSTGQGVDVMARRGSDWDVVVVLLGHNDAGSPGAYEPAARRILDQLARIPRVAWLTLHEVRPTFAQVNRFLRAQMPGRPNFWVADWNRTVSQHPDAVAGDGLHLKGTGPDLMADFVADVVTAEEFLMANPPTTTTLAPPTTTTTVASASATTTTTDTAEASSTSDSRNRGAEVALIGAFVVLCGVWAFRRSRHRDPRLR